MEADKVIWAAGAVPLRGQAASREVLLAHRPAHDDWVIPKGKVESKELLPRTAQREVAEEVSALIRLGVPLTPVRYPIAPGLKMVSWWVGVVSAHAPHKPDSEVDKVAWFTPEQALSTLTYADERGVLEEALSLPATTPLIIMRHAKAESRFTWRLDDAKRPLSARGRAQLPYVAQILTAFGATDLFSSPAVRCRQTLGDFANDDGLTIVPQTILGDAAASESALRTYAQALAREIGSSGVPAAVCTHAPTIDSLVDALGIPVKPVATASCVVIHLDAHGAVVREEWHDTLRVKVI